MIARRCRHNAYQRRRFEESVSFFRQAVPDDVQKRTARIVAAAGLSPGDRVLDVGTGTGVLIPHIEHRGVRRIVACDLSASMLAEVQRSHPQVRVWCGDVVELPAEFGAFDVVFFNAMFGNVWDQRLTLERTAERVSRGGRMVISHPMGARFVEELRRDDPALVPHPLPGAERVEELIRGLPLVRCSLRDEPDLYLCVLEKTRTN
ncbi:MAG: methyltransferase domain-containing protein [Gammaproteobacteria bacterium]|nr:methyltransferase domain-containing protein [Gammaproteobacteria bacterium]NIR88849.1 methyltransferase domain-containing protein [Gammaproteobacteria bacterium]NIU06453.1 methyltransferase domain-containing protein [Gammaproteobacteria bacterium]NIV53345.1 methyltransferase domain-containing protein [Gammaproteobacteria bacterium]NIV74064.1 methyltransferase domain-containing protein [Gammaproteobacteria bacterium]